MPARSFVSAMVLLASVACSSAGGGGSEGAGAAPNPGTPGRYYLEAPVRLTLSAQAYTGELTVLSQDQITLAASSGLCQPPTPADLQRDLGAGERTFGCGEARWVVRPVPGGVRGTIQATILEEYAEETTCPIGRAPPCMMMRTRTVTRRANLTVTPMT